jgi:hypothetical protein
MLIRISANELAAAVARAMVLLILLMASVPSRATLGDEEVSTETDRANMNARRAMHAGPGYVVHELQLPSGTIVREFVSPAGKVFAVAWRGPTLPDLRQLLGDENFQGFLNAPAMRQVPRRLRLVQLDQLVVHSAGRPRAFSGYAYVPALVPPGILVENLR